MIFYVASTNGSNSGAAIPSQNKDYSEATTVLSLCWLTLTGKSASNISSFSLFSYISLLEDPFY